MESMSKEIDGYKFDLQQLPAWQGFEVFGRLTKALGPSLAAVAKMVGDKSLSADKLTLLGGAIQGADVRELMVLGKQMLAGARVITPEQKQVKLTEDAFDLMFKGKLMTTMKLLVFAVQVNYSSFFDEWKSVVLSSSSGRQPTLTSPNSSSTDGFAADSSTPDGQPSAS